MELDLLVVGCGPFKYVPGFVPPGIIRYQMNSATVILTHELLEEHEVRLSIEYVDEPKMKLWPLLNHNSADDFDAFPARKAFHLRTDPLASPVTIDGAGLLKQDLILIHQHSILLTDFFLMRGSSSSIHQACLALSAFERRRLGYWMEKANL